jgi:hypothetical protein
MNRSIKEGQSRRVEISIPAYPVIGFQLKRQAVAVSLQA